MVRYRLLTGMVVFLLIAGVATLNCATAGELVKAHATSVNTKFEQLQVGDVDGHIIAIMESKQLWINDETGEKSFATSTGTMDINMKTGQGFMNTYTVHTYPNGEKWFSKGEGKPVGPGLMKGTFTYIGGTGQYEGIHGNGTWESQMMGPGVWFMKAEGTREYGGQ